MGIHDLLEAPEYQIRIVIVPDIFQSSAGYRGKLSEEYQNLSAVVYLDQNDMKHWSIKDGEKVTLSSASEKIVVIARESDEEHPGIGLMPPSVYSMRILSNLETSLTKIKKGDGNVSALAELLT